MLPYFLYLTRESHSVPTDPYSCSTFAVSQGGPFASRSELSSPTADRSVLKRRLLSHLDGLRTQPHIFVNVTFDWRRLIASGVACPVGHTTAYRNSFVHCLARFFTTPVRGSWLERRLESSRAMLPPSYRSVHVRTFGVDMGIAASPAVRPDSQAALAFYSWEARVSPQEYSAQAAALCKNGTALPPPIYVASDSRAAVALFESLCPAGAVISLTQALGGSATTSSSTAAPQAAAQQQRAILEATSRTHSDTGVARHQHNHQQLRDLADLDAALDAGREASTLDWLLLSHGRAITRWGAQHSSFATSALARSCVGGRSHAHPSRSPPSWQYSARGAWLMGKLKYHMLNRPRGLGRLEHECSASWKNFVNSTPCAGLCMRPCMQRLSSGYA